MGDFTVTTPPIAKFSNGVWTVPIYIQRGVVEKEHFADVYGVSKEIASMRAQLLVDAVNIGNKI